MLTLGNSGFPERTFKINLWNSKTTCKIDQIERWTKSTLINTLNVKKETGQSQKFKRLILHYKGNQTLTRKAFDNSQRTSTEIQGN